MVSAPWFSGKRQREVLAYSIEHMGKVLDSAKHLYEMLQYIRDSEFEKAIEEYREVRKLEDEADNVKRKIIDDLSKGVFHPLDREDLSRLVLIGDDIADYIKATGRKLAILIESGYRFSDEITSYLLIIAENLIKAIKLLIEAIKALSESIEKTITYTHMIEEIEEKIDDIRDEALKKILIECGEKFTGYCMLLKEALDDLEMASDRCEDTGDTLRTVVVSHT